MQEGIDDLGQPRHLSSWMGPVEGLEQHRPHQYPYEHLQGKQYCHDGTDDQGQHCHLSSGMGNVMDGVSRPYRIDD